MTTAAENHVEYIQETVARQRAYFRTGATRPMSVRVAALQRLKAEMKDREKQLLEQLWQSGNAPWKVWDD